MGIPSSARVLVALRNPFGKKQQIGRFTMRIGYGIRYHKQSGTGVARVPSGTPGVGTHVVAGASGAFPGVGTLAKSIRYRNLVFEPGRSSSGFVYLVAANRGTGVKIGWAVDPKKRLSQLQSGTREKLRLVYSRESTAAHRAERIAHREVADRRIRGEWFDVAHGEAKRVIDKAVDAAQEEMWMAATAHTKQERQAILEFIAKFEGADDYIGFKQINYCYRSWRETEGWPFLTDKNLALGLQAAGCRRRVVDGRSRNKGRYAAYLFPQVTP